MNTCTICGDPLLGVHHAENACCGSCYQLNLAGNKLALPSEITWDRGRESASGYLVYDPREGFPLLLEAARLECRESIELGQWMDANVQLHSPPFIPYEPRHMIQAIETLEEAWASLIAQHGRGTPASLPPASS